MTNEQPADLQRDREVAEAQAKLVALNDFLGIAEALHAEGRHYMAQKICAAGRVLGGKGSPDE